MSEPSATEQWHNLVRFAQANDIPVLRITPAQRRSLVQLPHPEHGVHPYQWSPRQGYSLFGMLLEEVPEGMDLPTAVERACLGPPRIRPDRVDS